MAKVFLDTNIYIDAVQRNKQKRILEQLLGNKLFISVLSVHILFYFLKLKLPSPEIESFISPFEVIDLDRMILANSLEQPTDDLEDNVQLQSAAEANCDYFLTNDKKLLKMKYFGKMKIVSTL